ncbi:hypothetical protein [Pseudomonas sp. Marseille-QA0892]
MKAFIRITAFTAVLLSFGSNAADWISLGNDPLEGEVDRSSVRRVGGTGFASIRAGIEQDGVNYFMQQDLAIYCGSAQMRILSGQISSSRSAKVVVMPDLPESDRIINLPVPNSGLSTLYEYVCRT